MIIANLNPEIKRPGYEFYPGDIKVEIYSNKPEFIEMPSTNEDKALLFNGQRAIQVTQDITRLLPGNINVTTKTKRIYFDKGAYRYGIATYLANPNSQDEKLVDQILSTFKFLE